jgi:pimeloyl-ACP methyl ester carboxylesterase
MKELKVLVKGLEINYKISGKGKPLLILHGWNGCSDSWVKVQKLLSNKGFRVIVPDHPGFGKSKTPSAPWGVSEYSNYVLNFIEKIKLQNFFVLGHSFGGAIAIKLAANHPEKINGLILCDSLGIKPKIDFFSKPFLITLIKNALLTPKHLIRFLDWAVNLFYVSSRHKDYPKAEDTMKETIKKILDEDLLPDLSGIIVRTLIVWGGDDRIVPLRCALIFNEVIEDSELEVLPKIGHSLHLEAPEKLAEIVWRFLK